MPAVASSMKAARPPSSAPRSVVNTPATVTIDPSAIARASAIGVLTGDGDGLGVGVEVGSGVGSGVGVAVGPGVGSGVGSGVGVAVDSGVGSGVASGVPLTVGSGVGESVGTAVGVDVGAGVGVGDGEGLSVGVAVALGVGVGTPPGTAGDARFCGLGKAETNQSDALSFVSVVLPAAPPGRRSMLDEAGGAPIGEPSTNAFVASPHPTASSTEPPTTRSAIAPPVAAKPPVYVVSPIAMYEPTLFTRRIRRPGARIVDTLQVALRVTVDPVEVA